MKFPVLFKRTRTGAIQFWEIETDGATVITSHGQVGGAVQETRDTIKRAKSADTVAAQADAEAEAKHLKQRKKGYVDSVAAAEAGKTGVEITGGLNPMLAYPYEKVQEHLRFPAYVQPKLDGHRCIGGETGLWTRTRKPITSVPHIEKAVKAIGLVWIDGELYTHKYRAEFEKITSLLRKQEPAPGHEIVEYHVYDIPGPGTFEQRLRALQSLRLPACIKMVETVLVANEAEMWAAFETFTKQGYEGAIVRNAQGAYEYSRSTNLMKLKTFEDAEFEIVGLEEGRGKLQGHCGAFVCKLPSGDTFRAKMVGELAKLKEAFEHPERWVGKMMTVKYQGLTAAGVPRFPVAMRLRQDVGSGRTLARRVDLGWSKVKT